MILASYSLEHWLANSLTQGNTAQSQPLLLLLEGILSSSWVLFDVFWKYLCFSGCNYYVSCMFAFSVGSLSYSFITALYKSICADFMLFVAMREFYFRNLWCLISE